MTSDILSQLEPEFASKIKQLIANCAAKGVSMVPYCGIRTPFEQAKLWRQSRTKHQVEEMLHVLKFRKAEFIRHCIESVGPQPMKGWATSTPPGISWHQWGKAVDCYLKDSHNNPDWNASSPGYAVYSSEATALGLTSGYNWPQKDAVHVQARSDQVLSLYTWEEVNNAMYEKFGSIDNSVL